MTQHITSKHEVVPEFERETVPGVVPEGADPTAPLPDPISRFTTTRRVDAGNPAGGTTSAVGVEIRWQQGPLGRGVDRKEPNGAFVETVILAAIDRLRFYQTAADGKFACQQNADAIEALALARAHLEARTREREQRGVEGTAQV